MGRMGFFKVAYSSGDNYVMCSCMMFARLGILCHHIMLVLKKFVWKPFHLSMCWAGGLGMLVCHQCRLLMGWCSTSQTSQFKLRRRSLL